jgi:DNA polymerase III epsilon subunit-like protein
MAILFFDTETTGVPRNYRAPISDLSNWPRIVQIAWLLTDSLGNTVEEAQYIIRPDGFTIPAGATAVHGITTRQAIEQGESLHQVVLSFREAVLQADRLVAHNIEFDEKVIGAEILRLGLSNEIELKPRDCTMQASTNYCKLPGPYGFKWPKLEELYHILFNHGFGNAHQALVDVRACARCFFEMRRLGIIS